MDRKDTGIFIMPRSSSDWKGAEALWITVAGWAAAAERKFGKAYILTTDKIASPQEVLDYPLQSDHLKGSKNSFYSLMPTVLKTLVKDILLWRKSGREEIHHYKEFISTKKPLFIWEQHDFFPGVGNKLAKKFKIPLIIYVHAPQVWESSKWGVKRPGWGFLIEKMELNSLRKADLVACVSQQVADKLEEMGVEKSKIMISPMAVDATLFEKTSSEDLKDKYQLKNHFVIGWIGSFRSFHGLDILLEIFKKAKQEINNAKLLLVGDGFEKENIEKLAKSLDIENDVIFAGRKTFSEIPRYIDLFDIAVVSAKSSEDFHYSPLKLREYLGAGKPTLAPNAGEIPTKFQDDIHVRLYNVGEIDATALKIVELFKNKHKREILGENGKNHILKTATWDVELDKALHKIF